MVLYDFGYETTGFCYGRVRVCGAECGGNADKGYGVVCWNHRAGFSLDKAQVFSGDLADASDSARRALGDALRVCDAVVHLAGKTSEGTANAEYTESVNVGATQRLAELAKECGVKRFVFVSSQSARISRAGSYGASKKRAEDVLLKSGVDAVILRPAIIYGSGNAGLFKKFADIVRKVPVIPIPYTAVTFQPVFVGDVVSSILSALEVSNPAERIFDVAGPDAVTFPGLIRAVARELGFSRVLIPVPMGLCILGAKMLALVLKKPPVTVDNLVGLTEVTPINLRPLKEILNVEPVRLSDGLKLALKVN